MLALLKPAACVKLHVSSEQSQEEEKALKLSSAVRAV